MLPSDYRQSRDAFRTLALCLGVRTWPYWHDEGEAQAGQARQGECHGDPDVSRLSSDVAYLGPADASTLVIVASGTHGVEAYAGAACQFHFLQCYRERFGGNGIGFLLVHAVNPWGYREDRRVTQEGVDLNRNFVDFSAPNAGRSEPAPKSSAYAAYHHLLIKNFRPLPAGLWNELRLYSRALTRERRRALQAAFTAGQHDVPDGLFYGGTGSTRARMVWESIVREYTDGRQRVFLLDIHTGLGPHGAGELISYLPPSAVDFRQMSGWFDGYLKSMADDGSVSAAVEGTLTAGFDRSLDCQSYAIGLEFGTVSPVSVLNAMRFDHWYHNNAMGLTTRHRELARKKMKAAFSGAEPQWHAQVIARFDQVMAQLVKGLL